MYQIVAILPTSRHSAGETSGTLLGAVAFPQTPSTRLVLSYGLKGVTQRGTSEDSGKIVSAKFRLTDHCKHIQ